MRKIKYFTFLSIFFAFLLQAKFAYALEVNYPSIFGIVINAGSTIAQYSCYLFGLITNLSFFIAVLSVAFGGVSYLVSYGSGKFTTEGKNWIKAGLTGLVLTVCAFLIAQTINPDLTVCKVSVLSTVIPTNLFTNSNNNTTPPPVGLNVKSYNEIPIGTLTENLLAGTNSCYEFDKNGDPIDFSTINSSAGTITDDNGTTYSNSDWYIPEYTNHDRVDCLMKYAEAAQKKYQLLAEIADQTSKQIINCTGLKQAGKPNYTYTTPAPAVFTFYGGTQNPTAMPLANFSSLFPYNNVFSYLMGYYTGNNPAFNSAYCSAFTQGVINGGPSVLVPDRKCINVPGAVLYQCPDTSTSTNTNTSTSNTSSFNNIININLLGSITHATAYIFSALNLKQLADNFCSAGQTQPCDITSTVQGQRNCVCDGNGENCYWGDCNNVSNGGSGSGGSGSGSGGSGSTNSSGSGSGGSGSTNSSGSGSGGSGSTGTGTKTTCDMVSNRCKTISEGFSCKQDSDCSNAFNGNYCQKSVCMSSNKNTNGNTATCSAITSTGTGNCQSMCSGGTCTNNTDTTCQTQNSSLVGYCSSSYSASNGTCTFVTDQTKNASACLMPDNTYGVCDGTPGGGHVQASGGTGTCVNNSQWCQRSNPAPSTSSCIGGPACPTGTMCDISGACKPIFIPLPSTIGGSVCLPGTICGVCNTDSDCNSSSSTFWQDPCIVSTNNYCFGHLCFSGLLPTFHTDGTKCVVQAGSGTELNKFGACSDGACTLSCQTSNPDDANYCSNGTCPNMSKSSTGSIDTNICQNQHSDQPEYCNGKITGGDNGPCQNNNPQGDNYCNSATCTSTTHTIYPNCNNDPNGTNYCYGSCNDNKGPCQTKGLYDQNGNVIPGYCYTVDNNGSVVAGRCLNTQYSSCQENDGTGSNFCSGTCSAQEGACQNTSSSSAGFCNSPGNITNTVGDNYSCETENKNQHGYCTGKCSTGPINCQNTNPFDYSYCSMGYCYTATQTPCQTSNSNGNSYCQINTCNGASIGRQVCNPVWTRGGAYLGGGGYQCLGTSGTNVGGTCGVAKGTCSDDKAPCQITDSSASGYCDGSCIFANAPCQDADSTLPGYCTGKCMDYLGSSNPGCSQAGGTATNIVGNIGSGFTPSGSANGTITNIGNCQINSSTSPGYCSDGKGGHGTCNPKNVSTKEITNLVCQSYNDNLPGYCDGKCVYNPGNDQTIQSTGSGDAGGCQTSDPKKPFYCKVGGCLFATSQVNSQQDSDPVVTNTGKCNGFLFNNTNSYIPTVPQITPTCQTNSPFEPNYCNGTCDFTRIDACQTSSPGQRGYCSGTCSTGICQTNKPGDGGYCVLEHNMAGCKDATKLCTASGNCSGVCINGTGNCQTGSPTAPGYCVTAVTSCQTFDPQGTIDPYGAGLNGPCQAQYPGQPGYCSDDAHKNLYNTATCADNGPCQATNSNKRGYCNTKIACLTNGRPCQSGNPLGADYCGSCQKINPIGAGYCRGGSCFGEGMCQTTTPGNPGYCSINGGSTGGCKDNGPCQTNDYTKPGYCTSNITSPITIVGVMTNSPPTTIVNDSGAYCATPNPNNNACQIDDSTKPGFCVGGTCADTSTPACQTFSSTSPGFCQDGTCNKYVSQCQTTDSTQPGYCNSQPSCNTGIITDSSQLGASGYIGFCQTKYSDQPGFCNGACADSFGACQNTDPNNGGYCSYGLGKPAPCNYFFPTISNYPSSNNCQTQNSDQPGYCKNGSCVDEKGPCQTNDPTSFGYCKTNATCGASSGKGACQTDDNSKSGYCSTSPTCSDKDNPCQTKNPDGKGYCSNGKCDGNGLCHTNNDGKSGYCENNAVCNSPVVAQTVDPTQASYSDGPFGGNIFEGYNSGYACAQNKSYVNPCICQTGDGTKASYCSNSNNTATCSDQLGPCQTYDSSKPGYCVNGTCSNNDACKCQTTVAGKPGFCTGTCPGSIASTGNTGSTTKAGYCDNTVCLDSAPTCQTDTPNNAGYCTGKCNGNTCIYDLSKYNGLGEFGAGGGAPTTKDITINGKTVTLINKTAWKQSSLSGQLNYIANTIKTINTSIRVDASALNQAKTTLNQCYAPVTYIDLIKSYQNLDKKDAVCQSTMPQKADFCASTSNMCSDNFGNCQDTNQSGSGYCAGKCINSLAPCQTDSPGYAGYCEAVCADDVANCQDTTPNLNSYCSNGKCADNKAACQTDYSDKDGFCGATCSSNDACQNTDPNGKGYCQGTCNGDGPCQTNDKSKAGYCQSNATCVQNLGNCQTTDNTQPGFCNGVCNNMTDAVWLNPVAVYPSARCQTDPGKIDQPGYCTGECVNMVDDNCKTGSNNFGSPGYCSTTCSGSTGPCQTTDASGAGYCNGTCNNMPNNCQTSDKTAPGYCKNGSCVTNIEPAVDTSKYCAGFSYDNIDDKNCSSYCSQKYAYNSVEYTSCQDQCANAKCLANNSATCSLCQSGSNEYAGYPDCLNPECTSDSDCSSTGGGGGTCNNGFCGVKCKANTDCSKGEQSCINGICYKQCSKDDNCPAGKMCTNGVCVRKYSSSFLYDNIQKEKCANPYVAASSGSVCYSSGGASCQQTCPETAKCPTSSSCPNCPCGQQSATFLVPAKSDICNTGMEGVSQKITVPIASQLVNGTCDKEIYSKDPLTFYCESSWLNDPTRDGLSITPMGAAMNCGKNQEIPVGQTVDDSENWANNLNLQVSTFVDSLGVGCSDDFLNCLSGIWNQNVTVKNNYVNLYKFSVQDSRSDPLKELTYSRQSIDTDNKIENNVDSQTKLMTCTRAEDEGIPSVVNDSTTFMDQTTKGYCYGQKLGQLYSSCKLPGGALTDNWFFCEPQGVTANK